jgi:nicotinamidase-related amidase
MTRALLIIDIQRDYFPGGAFPLVGTEEAAAVAHRVLGQFRAAGEPIIHVQHVAGEPDARFFRAGTAGVEIHPLVAPQDGELLVQKAEPNSFVGTTLATELDNRKIDQLVVVGMMSSMCVDATTRAALDLGQDVTVVHDGCAAPDLEFNGAPIAGAVVHAAFMAALGGAGARVISAAELGPQPA